MGKVLGFPEDKEFTAEEIIDIRVKIAKGEAIALDEAGYRDFLSKTTIALVQEGQTLVDEIADIIKTLDSNDADRPKLDLALQKLKQSRHTFQGLGLHSNSTHDKHDELRGTAWRPRVLKI